MNSLDLLELIKIMIDEKKGEHIVTLDLLGKGSFVDYMVIASAGSNRQLVAICDFIAHGLKERGIKTYAEGLPDSDWILIDAGDVMVHLFKPETREYYNLEKMWGGPEVEAATLV